MAKAPVNEEGKKFTAAIAEAMRNGELTNEQYNAFRANIANSEVDPWIRQELAKADAFRYGMPYTDPTAARTIPDLNGMGSDGSTRTPQNTQGSSQPWIGSSSHDPDGNVIPGGPADPQPPNYTGGGDPFAGNTNGNFGQGGGAINGPAPVDWGAIDSALRPPLTGWDASTNKDFYQKQFQDLRTQDNGFRLRQMAAALRGEQAQNEPPADPWAWANLPEVTVGGGQQTTPISWDYNNNYGINEGMTNQQAGSAVSALLNENELALLNKLWQDRPDVASGNNWLTAGSPQAAQTQIAGGSTPRSPELTDVVSKILNNIYLQQGGASGPNVPEGYAAPIAGGA